MKAGGNGAGERRLAPKTVGIKDALPWKQETFEQRNIELYENHHLIVLRGPGYRVNFLHDPAAAKSLSQHRQYSIGCWIFGWPDLPDAATNRFRHGG